MHITIKRRTRKDLVIESADSLSVHIKKIVKNFKRFSERNSQILSNLRNEYANINEFKTHLRGLLGVTRGMPDHLLLSCGYNDAEILEYKNMLANRTKKFLEASGISPSEYHRTNSNRCAEYWTRRGFTEEEAKLKISEQQCEISSKCTNETKRSNSPLSVYYYEDKGISEQAANIIISDLQKCRSKRNIEYWLSRGFSKEESLIRLKEYQSSHLKNKTEEEKKEILKKRIPRINIKTLQNQEFKEPGLFYVIQIKNNKYKIGITVKQTIRQRYGNSINGLEFREYKCSTITEAYKIEQRLRKIYDGTIEKKDYGVFGWTEVVTVENFDEIEKQFYTELEKLNENN